MLFEPLLFKDLPEIGKLSPEGWEDITPIHEFYINSKNCYPLKVIINNKIVGLGTSIVFKNSAWLAHIIVDQNFRNKGIGYKMVEHLLQFCKNTAIETILLVATDLGQPVYSKAGFRVLTEYSNFKKEKSHWKQSISEKNIFPFKDEFCSAILEIDKKISGENREKFITDYFTNALVYIDKDKVLGYFLPDLKDGLIYAENTNAGIELMKIKYEKIDKAVIPSENIPGIEFLKQNGFVYTGKRGTRMIHGKDITWHPDKIFSWGGGNIG
jgi:GNAT superfamily N-acetyltransferase